MYSACEKLFAPKDLSYPTPFQLFFLRNSRYKADEIHLLFHS